MRKLVVLAGVALLALPLSIHAQGQVKGSQGQAGGQGRLAQTGSDADAPGKRGNSGASKQADRAGPAGAGRSAEAPGRDRGEDQGKRASPATVQGQAQRVVERRGAKADTTTLPPVQANRGRDFRIRTIENGRYAWRDPGFQGCPPGLAKKGNGCLPPGQARKLSGFDDGALRWYRYADWYRADRGYDWRYDRGYAYRVDPATSLVQSILPLLGGALFGGNSWPQSYVNYEVPPYYGRYYGSDAAYDYRYADGAVFAVNPKTQVIQSIAGLLTGDSWAIGSPMPQGYDLYNVPYDYRDRYADSGDRWYRYDDGYVYEIDPTTQLVRKLIELVV